MPLLSLQPIFSNHKSKLIGQLPGIETIYLINGQHNGQNKDKTKKVNCMVRDRNWSTLGNSLLNNP